MQYVYDIHVDIAIILYSYIAGVVHVHMCTHVYTYMYMYTWLYICAVHEVSMYTVRTGVELCQSAEPVHWRVRHIS